MGVRRGWGPDLSPHSPLDPRIFTQLVFKINYRLIQVKNIAEWELFAILLTFIKLPFVIKIFVLSIFDKLNHRSLKFGPYITYIASKPKAHGVITNGVITK